MEDVNDTIISTPATTDALDEDLVLDLREVTLVRDGRTLLHPVTWQVEVDERWIIIGPNGAGKTSLLTIAGARDTHPAPRLQIVCVTARERCRRVMANVEKSRGQKKDQQRSMPGPVLKGLVLVMY